MEFELAEEHRMLADLAQRFVREHLYPLEAAVLERDAEGQGSYLTAEEKERLDKVSQEMGLWSLDAPEEVGGMALPYVALVAVNEAMGSSAIQYHLPPDSPNLRMLVATAKGQQVEAYLQPYARGETVSAIGISEPGAGADPRGMKTKAVYDEAADEWVINGRKIWITRAAEADFTILMAVTDPETRAMSAFLVDRDAPGFNVLRRIPMLGGEYTYEVTLEDCRVPGWKLLGEEGGGFAPMQVRLGTRRMEMAAWSIGAAQRALDMMTDYAPQRTVFGETLAQKQAVQWWVADGATKIHAARLMAYDCAWKLDEGRDVRTEISMLKVFATEMAQEIIDQAMQVHGAMGVTKELPLQMLAGKIRNMRIYDGPSEVHRMVVARNLMNTRGQTR
ncbi:acyl-CoA dehydrogenase [Pacificimonas flava]|uniref:Acyl-CoA dehydrogenase n=2 Tax=Pacificimonas TaxID=1960290 RepID=A0A219B0Z1_9SPHN|nr:MULTISPECIES: acyl-CoA dehydrogenase [Pacificimonas]MBZ6379739.1 acyl-CoA dehydrogenase [Pacificimonas aurantium]OWV31806.1 acyl-CoA dehydrogenase [Pacificimonas flava]